MTGPSFTCPQCSRTSYNPNDAEHGYCGACHAFTGPGRADDVETNRVVRVESPAHRLICVDSPGAPLRRAWCACGNYARVTGWSEALRWIGLHKDDPTAPPAVLATRAES